MKPILQNFDFQLLQNPDFKEDSVREEIILPILKNLGYSSHDIVRSKKLEHPFVNIGSQKRQVNIFPDYLLKVQENYAWVLDAKKPNEDILTGKNVEQVYSYAIHPEIRTKFFALCNGREFSLFRDSESRPILYFPIEDLDNQWDKLQRFLSTDSFQVGKSVVYETPTEYKKVGTFDYQNRPLLDEIVVQKQSAKRHFGVHGYFTKQAWNVVQEYIKNFSQPNDLVLDVFGGSGVTAVEAMMTDRKAIHIDLNPMSVFMISSLVAPIKQSELIDAFNRIKADYLKKEPTTDEEIQAALEKYPYPKGIKLPRGSDVENIEQLFSPKQLAQLSLLKHLIKREKKENIKKSLLLMFSGLLTKVNLTYHNNPNRPSEGQGDSSAFRYYRYRIAPNAVEIDLMKYFRLRLDKILNAKKEIDYKINENTIENIQVLKGDATNLNTIKSETVDYIYTDPPYGNKIPYLDLSIMWNAWLDLEVTQEDYKKEAIEGGELKKGKAEYNKLIAKSIEEMYRVLKYDRWMSFVFAHKDPEFWHLIIDTAERAGFEYAGAVKQANGQTSFKKRQHPFTVLSGQLIINFKKVRNPKAILKANLGMDISEVVMQTIEGIIAKNNGANLEQINDELIIKGLELGFLDLLKKKYTDLTPILLENFDYNDSTELFTIKKNTQFRTHIDEKLRIRYYLISYLRRMEREKKTPDFDEIVLETIPLLRNGKTPDKQTIQNVLEDLAEHANDKGGWKLKKQGQLSLFV